MESLKKVEIVSFVVKEIKNNLDIVDEDLADFVIEICENHLDDPDHLLFLEELRGLGASLEDAFVQRIWEKIKFLKMPLNTLADISESDSETEDTPKPRSGAVFEQQSRAEPSAHALELLEKENVGGSANFSKYYNKTGGTKHEHTETRMFTDSTGTLRGCQTGIPLEGDWGMPVDPKTGPPKKKKKNEYQAWEDQQLRRLNNQHERSDDDSIDLDMPIEETVDVEVKDVQPAFLRTDDNAFSPQELQDQFKVCREPEGSLARVATSQSQLQRERREHKEMKDKEAAARGVQRESPKLGQQGFVSYGFQSTLPLQAQRESLPIFQCRNQLLRAFKDNQVLVIIGETGSGKTTQMPQYLAETGVTGNGDKMIGITQPRRVAAISVAKRVAEEYGCRCGQEVGYSIRFEDITSRETEIKFMTDGILLREALMDPLLSRYSVIILDEAHERSVSTDVLFGLLKRCLRERTDDFRLIVTSATLDAEKFSGYFFNASIFTIPGRNFPVDIYYALTPESDYVEVAMTTIMQIHLREKEGDILVFMTGQEEIDFIVETINERMEKIKDVNPPPLIMIPVYSALPSEMQSLVFEKVPKGSRKCVVATNIAEASLTIDGVCYVIDPGFSKINMYDPKNQKSQLLVLPISQASARQRAGRAGRTQPGSCYRLYTEKAYKLEMSALSVPEIQRTNLCTVVLLLKAMGINDVLNFDFMDPPNEAAFVAAMMTLYSLGALDDEGLLTRLGRKMAEFPLDPRISKVLLASVDLGCTDEAITVSVMLLVQNVFYRPKEKQQLADQRKARFHQAEGDHCTLLEVYNVWSQNRFSHSWCFENFIQLRAMKRAQDCRKQLLGIMDRYRLDIQSCGKDYTRLRKAMCSGFFSHVCRRDTNEPQAYRTLADNQLVYIHPTSSLFQRVPDWIFYHEVVETTREYMREVCTLEPTWLPILAPNYFRTCQDSTLSKKKRGDKIEPLFSKHESKDAWRLSARKG